MDKKHAIFEQLKNLHLQPSPYLKTRVLGELASRKRERKKVMFWQIIAGCSVAFSFALLVFLRAPETQQFEAQVGRAFVVRIEVEALRKFEVAEAEIDLPGGVEFYSKGYPELSKQKTLRMAWTDKTGKFPVVLRAVQPGKKTVKVLFFDREHNLVSERTFNVTLKEAS